MTLCDQVSDLEPADNLIHFPGGHNRAPFSWPAAPSRMGRAFLSHQVPCLSPRPIMFHCEQVPRLGADDAQSVHIDPVYLCGKKLTTHKSHSRHHKTRNALPIPPPPPKKQTHSARIHIRARHRQRSPQATGTPWADTTPPRRSSSRPRAPRTSRRAQSRPSASCP